MGLVSRVLGSGTAKSASAQEPSLFARQVYTCKYNEPDFAGFDFKRFLIKPKQTDAEQPRDATRVTRPPPAFKPPQHSRKVKSRMHLGTLERPTGFLGLPYSATSRGTAENEAINWTPTCYIMDL
jgi:hypothetical protein